MTFLATNGLNTTIYTNEFDLMRPGAGEFQPDILPPSYVTQDRHIIYLRSDVCATMFLSQSPVEPLLRILLEALSVPAVALK